MDIVAEQIRDTAYYHGAPTPVPIFQREWEFAQALRLYAERRPHRVLEVGTYHGGTLYHWLSAAQPKAVVVSIDSYAVGVDNRHLYADWVSAGVKLHVLAGDSRDPSIIAQAKRLGPFDWIFIDAGHYEAEVQADWDNYRALAASGAVVLFHDILTHPAWPSIEVEKVWRRIQRQGYVTQEFVADSAAEWGGIGCAFMS